MPRPVPTLKGELVTLRPPDPVADAHDYFEMNREPDLHIWTGNHVLPSEAAAQVELEKFLSMDEISTWMIIDNPSHRVVGRFFLCLEGRDRVRVVGEGNRIAKPVWRKGHNRQARQLLFPYVFEELDVDVYETGAWAGNTNSIKSIESYGFELDREEEKWNDKQGKELTMRYYTMTKEQWESVAHQALRTTR